MSAEVSPTPAQQEPSPQAQEEVVAKLFFSILLVDRGQGHVPRLVGVRLNVAEDPRPVLDPKFLSQHSAPRDGEGPDGAGRGPRTRAGSGDHLVRRPAGEVDDRRGGRQPADPAAACPSSGPQRSAGPRRASLAACPDDAPPDDSRSSHDARAAAVTDESARRPRSPAIRTISTSGYLSSIRTDQKPTENVTTKSPITAKTSNLPPARTKKPDEDDRRPVKAREGA